MLCKRVSTESATDMFSNADDSVDRDLHQPSIMYIHLMSDFALGITVFEEAEES